MSARKCKNPVRPAYRQFLRFVLALSILAIGKVGATAGDKESEKIQENREESELQIPVGRDRLGRNTQTMELGPKTDVEDRNYQIESSSSNKSLSNAKSRLPATDDNRVLGLDFIGAIVTQILVAVGTVIAVLFGTWLLLSGWSKKLERNHYPGRKDEPNFYGRHPLSAYQRTQQEGKGTPGPQRVDNPPVRGGLFEQQVLESARAQKVVQWCEKQNLVKLPPPGEPVFQNQLEQVFVSVTAILENCFPTGPVMFGDKDAEFVRADNTWRRWLNDQTQYLWKQSSHGTARVLILIDPSIIDPEKNVSDDWLGLEGRTTGLRIPALRVLRVSLSPFETWWNGEGRVLVETQFGASAAEDFSTLCSNLRTQWYASFATNHPDSRAFREACCEYWLLALRDLLIAHAREAAGCGCLAPAQCADWVPIFVHIENMARKCAGLEVHDSNSTWHGDSESLDWWVPEGSDTREKDLFPALRRTRDNRIFGNKVLLPRKASGWRQEFTLLGWAKIISISEDVEAKSGTKKIIAAAWRAMADYEHAAEPSPLRLTRVIRRFWLPLWELSWCLPAQQADSLRTRLEVAMSNIGMRIMKQGEGYDQYFDARPSDSTVEFRPALVRREDSSIIERGVFRGLRSATVTSNGSTASPPTGPRLPPILAPPPREVTITSTELEHLLMAPVRQLKIGPDSVRNTESIRAAIKHLVRLWTNGMAPDDHEGFQKLIGESYFKPLFKLVSRSRMDGNIGREDRIFLDQLGRALESVGLIMVEEDPARPSNFMKPMSDETPNRPALYSRQNKCILRGTTSP